MKNQLVLLVAEMHDSGILYSEAVREFKKSFLSHVLQQNRGNQSKAAKLLGMHRNTLSRTLAELDLDVRLLRLASAEPSSTQYKEKDRDREREKDTRHPPRSVSATPQIDKKAAR